MLLLYDDGDDAGMDALEDYVSDSGNLASLWYQAGPLRRRGFSRR